MASDFLKSTSGKAESVKKEVINQCLLSKILPPVSFNATMEVIGKRIHSEKFGRGESVNMEELAR